MISKLSVFNFQSHKETHLDLSPGVNIVIGNSDSGKSALIRAIRWLSWNRPNSNAFRSHWGGETKVAIEVDNHTIERIRDKRNLYTLDGEEFEAIKTDVPEEISRILNFDEVCFGYQFDRPFLLDSSPGEVAQHFNRIAHLDIIDNANANVQSWYRQIEQDIRANEQRKSELEQSLLPYVNLDEQEKRLVALEAKERFKEKLQKESSEIESLSVSIKRTIDDISRIGDVAKHESRVKQILSSIETRENSRKTLDNALKLAEQLKTCVQDVNRFKTIVDAEKRVLKIEGWIKARDDVKKQKEALCRLLDDIEDAQEGMEKNEARQKQLQTEFDKNMPDICPLCGRNR